MQSLRLVRGFAGVALGVPLLTAPLVGQETTRVSVDSAGTEANDSSGPDSSPALSADGRIATFSSKASNLVAGDTNGVTDVFVHDRLTGLTERVSVDSAGMEANHHSSFFDPPALSLDGRIVAFSSWASNLVAGDGNGFTDVFVHDRSTGLTERVSVDSSGKEGNHDSKHPAVSADGRTVAFSSSAWNLVAGDTNRRTDIFVHDRVTGTTERVNVDSAGVQGDDDSYDPSISADGQVVAFSSFARNLVAGDTNGTGDIFVHDRSTGITERVSVDSAGKQGNGNSAYPSISADGQIVAFSSLARNLVAADTNATIDVFVHDRSTGITERVSVDTSGTEGNGLSQVPAISADGRTVAFESLAWNLVTGDTNGTEDVFVHDRSSGLTERVSVDSVGAEGDYGSGGSSISGDGQTVAFWSQATNLVGGDSGKYFDVFVRDRCPAARWANYGAGFPGTLGVPAIGLSGDPALGTTATLAISNSFGLATIGLLSVGLDMTQVPTNWGGDLLVDSRFPPVLIQIPAAGFDLPLRFPDDGLYCGLELYWQALELDAGAAHGVSFTAGLDTVLGR